MTPERTMARMATVARILTTPFVRYEIRGGACARDLHVGVVAVNHRSLFDVVAGLIGLDAFRRYPRLLIAETYVVGRWTAPFARAIGAIPVARGARGPEAVAHGVQALREGIPLLVMPEGHLHRDPDDPTSTDTGRPGVSRLAVGASMPVLTAGLSGTEAVWPPTSRLPRLNPLRRKVVRIRVADEPLLLSGDDHQANAERVMASIRDLLRADAAAPGTPAGNPARRTATPSPARGGSRWPFRVGGGSGAAVGLRRGQAHDHQHHEHQEEHGAEQHAGVGRA